MASDGAATSAARESGKLCAILSRRMSNRGAKQRCSPEDRTRATHCSSDRPVRTASEPLTALSISSGVAGMPASLVLAPRTKAVRPLYPVISKLQIQAFQAQTMIMNSSGRYLPKSTHDHETGSEPASKHPRGGVHRQDFRSS